MEYELQEWCWARCSESYYERSPCMDPRGETSGSFPQRLLRGGLCVFRGCSHPGDPSPDTVFRIARNYQPKVFERSGPERADQGRFTARGPIERFGKGQWNVLVLNADEIRAFWAEQKIDTRLDWSGEGTPRATVSRKELVARCDAAGEGAKVEYVLEVQDRASGGGVRGVDLRVVDPPGAGSRSESRPPDI